MSDKTVSSLKPKALLKELSRRCPGIWERIKHFRRGKEQALLNWPDWCYMPIAAGRAITSNMNSATETLLDPVLSPASVTALATWRVSQGVYRFDSELFIALIGQPFEGNIPCETLKRLPEWCVYIETNNFKSGDINVEGFFAHLESDIANNRTELRLLLVSSTGANVPVPLHLGDWTLEESMVRFGEESAKYIPKKLKPNMPAFGKAQADMIAPFLQLVLYLCAENADIPVRPSHPNTRVRMSGQVDVPKEARVWTVGERIGASIRKYRNEEMQHKEMGGTHASPRPHIRRAHWHHFRTGPKTDEQKLVLHWLAPIPVGFDDEQELPAVIHKVKSPHS